jgi:hypothetical protein
MFSFVVKYLGFLKKLPFVAHVFDSQFKLWILITNRALARDLEGLELEVGKWEGVSVGMHVYGGVQFNYQDREIGHLHGNGLLDVLFSKKIKFELMNQGLINDHHVFSKSGWISFYIKKENDAAYAIELLRMAYMNDGK